MTRFVVLLIAITVLAGGWIAAWFLAAGAIKNNAEQFMRAGLDTSVQVACEKFDVGGFPLSLEASCAGLQVWAGDLTLSLPRIKVMASVFRPTRALVQATGPARITDAFSGSSRKVRWDDLRASVTTNGWALERLELEASNLELVDNIVGEKLIARVKRFEALLTDIEQKYDRAGAVVQLAALMRVEQLVFPEFELADTELRLEATVDAIPDDFRKWSLQTIAGNWFRRQTGIDLLAFEGRDGISEFELSGRLSTTEQARLSGDFALQTKNVTERLARLIEPTSLQILFGYPSGDGGRDQSYTLRHGVLLAGNLPILTFEAMN